MNEIKACIFDLDGVICDTAKYHYLAWKKLADELGIGFTEEDNEHLKGVSRMESLNYLLSLGNLEFEEHELVQMAEKKNECYKEMIQNMTCEELLEGVHELIQELKQHNIKIALGSVSKNAPSILNSLGIEALFDAVIDGNKVTKAKPDPEVFLTAARELELSPENCIVFEDAFTGVEAAHNAHMKCIGIGDNTTLCKADYVIPGFRDFSLEKLHNIAF